MPADRALYRLILRASERFGTSQRLADAAGVSLSHMLRGAKAGQLGTDALLAIAEASGEDPNALLAASGKGDVASRIERLYGKPRAGLSADDRVLIDLPDDTKRHLRRVLETLRARRA